MEKKIKDFILSGCSTNRRDNNQYSYKVEAMIFTAKSLLPSLNVVGSRIDYGRFNEELKLWFFYRHGENKSLINCIDWSKDIYWQEDDSIYSRLVPIVCSNENWDIVIDEVIKNILFTTGNIACLFEGIALSKLLFLALDKTDLDDIKLKIKEETINFSQLDYISAYKNYYRDKIDNFTGNYKVDFERKRIQLINILNSQSLEINKYRILKTCFKILDGKGLEENGIQCFFTYGLKGLMEGINDKNQAKNNVFIENLCSYLYRLRKGRIYPSKLKINDYVLPDIFNFIIGDKFFHSLLNNCQVINRVDNREETTVYVKAKSGMYKFKKGKKSSRD